MRENPNGSTGEFFGLTHPHSPCTQRRQHDGAQAGGGEHRSDHVEPRLRAAAQRVPHEGGHHQDPDHDDDLAGEDDAAS